MSTHGRLSLFVISGDVFSSFNTSNNHRKKTMPNGVNRLWKKVCLHRAALCLSWGGVGGGVISRAGMLRRAVTVGVVSVKRLLQTVRCRRLAERLNPIFRKQPAGPRKRTSFVLRNLSRGFH